MCNSHLRQETRKFLRFLRGSRKRAVVYWPFAGLLGEQPDPLPRPAPPLQGQGNRLRK